MSTIVDQPEHYFKQFIPERDELLVELEAEAEREDIPITGPVVGELLYILACAAKARRILELGTATGYSAIYLAKACEAFNGRVVSLENDSAMATRAQQNFQRAGIAHFVEIQVKDALEALPQMKGTFDYIFMDIEKQDYIRALPDCERLSRRLHRSARAKTPTCQKPICKRTYPSAGRLGYEMKNKYDDNSTL
mgnify:CR=1 FL=1